MSFDNRMRCLQDLRITGFQTCGGFMVGRPHQTPQVFVNSKTVEVQELLLQSRCENEKWPLLRHFDSYSFVTKFKRFFGE